MTDDLVKIDIKPENPTPHNGNPEKPTPHNGNSISRIEKSENGDYLISYSEGSKDSKDDKSSNKSSIVVWKVIKIKNKVENSKYKLVPVSMIDNVGNVYSMCFSNKKILAFTYLIGHNLEISK